MARRSSALTRGLVALATVVVLVVAIALIGRTVYRSVTGHVATQCQSGEFVFSPDQAVVASTMTSVVVRRNLPERAAVLTLAAALQESKLRNIPAGQGDRDSVGVLQQRPSQGWGTAAQLADVTFATGAFLDALVKVPSWQRDPLAEVIQSVQISADGNAYAQHGPQAQAMADALTGRTARGLSCTFETPTEVAGTDTVAAQLTAALPVNRPTLDGRVVSVSGAQWTTVAWFVANADRLGLDQVDYGGGRWTRRGGWKDADTGSDAVRATLHG